MSLPIEVYFPDEPKHPAITEAMCLAISTIEQQENAAPLFDGVLSEARP